MKKRFVYFVLLILALTLVSADLELEFVAQDNADFQGYLLTLNFADAVYKEVLDDSLVTVPSNEQGTFKATLDSLNTSATDYYGVKEIKNVNQSKIVVYPVGYLHGEVLDIKGNLVPGAELSFTCFAPVVFDYPPTTDDTGFFSAEMMPVGGCSVIASSQDHVGNTDFWIKKGEKTSLEIVLEKPVAQNGSKVFIILFILLILILILTLVLFLLKKRKSNNGKKQKTSREDQHSKQTLVLLETLSEKEKKIVEFLLSNKHHSSQAKIRHSTRIPRTSLSRTLKKLEEKKIVKINKYGKMVSVELTGFFLDK